MTDAVAEPGGAPGQADERSGPIGPLLLLGNVDSIHVRRWATFFAGRGHDVHVAGFRDASIDDARLPVPVHRLGRPKTAFIRYRQLVRRLRPSIVHAHYLTYYGWFARAAAGCPIAVTLWGSDVLLDVPASRVRRTWARAVLRAAACVTADSPVVIEAAIRLGARPAATHEIQFGVDTGRFRPDAPAPELVARLGLVGRRVVLSPRSITPVYRTLVLIEALRRLPDDVILVGTLAGADEAYLARVRSAISDAGLGDRVRLGPGVDHGEIHELYRAADVVVSVPVSDGTPVSVLEGMATGRPVVATDLPSLRPWLGPIAPELLVPIDDPASTAAAIRHALELPAGERARLAAASRAVVVERADHEANMLRMEGLYRAMVGAR